jgi:TolB-like protein/DNA-binding SARP family transcriptional activator/Tfp pilus assembly protein PilF
VTETADAPNLAARFHLRTLGTLALIDSTGATILGAHGRHKRRLALLSAVAAAGERGRSRDQLLVSFWPDASQVRARHSLDQLLYALRNSLSDEVFAGVNPLRINESVVESDVANFVSACERQEYATAVDCYGGPFLDGFYLGDSPEFEQWVDAERARLAAKYTDALERLARAAGMADDHSSAVRWWRALTECESLSGQYAAGYMRALIHAGDSAAALRHAERHAALLAQELGVEPGPEVSKLVGELRTKSKWPSVIDEQPSAAVVSRVEEVSPPRADSAPRISKRRQRRDWVRYAAGLFAVALLVAGARWAIAVRGNARDPAAGTGPSIAVLPLANVGEIAENAAIVDGLTDELISVLSKLERLKIVSRASSLAFKNSNLDARRIADSLGVTHLLRTSVQKDSTRLRVRVQLIEGRDGAMRWAESYDGDLRDVLRAQSEIAAAVARDVDVRLGPDRPSKPKRRSTANVAAHELFLKGNDPTLLRSDSAVRLGLTYLDSAIALDSTFAAAYAARSRLTFRLAFSDDTSMTRHDRIVIAERFAVKALALDDSSADAHATASLIYRRRFDFRSAEPEMKRAITLDPTTAVYHEWLSQQYIMTERPAEALAEARRAVESAPLSATANAELARALLANDRPDEALQVIAEVRSLSPLLLRAGSIAAECYARKGMWREAIEELRPSLAKTGPRGRALYGYLLARAGRTDEARDVLASLLARLKYGGDAGAIATVYVGLGEKQEALNWLSKASVDGMPLDNLPMLLRDLAPDPRLQSIRRRLGIER